jgi:hypothetical protein
MTDVAQMLGGLRQAIASQDPDAHLKEGTEALHTPPSQLEVGGGEALPPISEDPKSDLLLELVEEK